MAGRLVASRSPPHPNTTTTRPRSPRRAVGDEVVGGGEELLEAVGRVGVVDDDRERLAGVDQLEAAGHDQAAREPVGDGGVVDAERRPRRGPRRGRWRR